MIRAAPQSHAEPGEADSMDRLVIGVDVGTGSARELIDAFLARAAAEGDLRRTQYEIQIGSADLLRAAGTLVEEARLRGGAHTSER